MQTNSRRRLVRGFAVAAFLALAGSAAQAYHGTLQVYVNGQRLTPEEIHYVEQVTGTRFASGYYWYDPNSGYWGVVGGPVMGQVAPATGGGGQGSGTFRSYGDGSWGYRNPNTGTGMMYDPDGGGSWQDRVWIQPD